jgi:geranylgeranyl diphosphate synthase, type I
MNDQFPSFQSHPLILEMRVEIEKFLHKAIISEFPDKIAPLRKMLEYHLGWDSPEPGGKRLRPLLLLLSCHSAGGNWHIALPAAAAVELIHNFSLIHDDIQDHSLIRHHAPTLWTKVGVAQAINAGDAMFAAGLKQIWQLEPDFPLETIKRCNLILEQTCLSLTNGQYLDIDFENRDTVSVQEYLEMVSGKTTSLITACMQIGAILGSTDPQATLNFANIGTNLGMAFQLVDDYLGVWGETETTGKSNLSDLISHKKSFPIILGMGLEGFTSLWSRKTITEDTARLLVKVLEQAGIKEKTSAQADEFTHQAIESIHQACKDPADAKLLEEITRWLLRRNS